MIRKLNALILCLLVAVCASAQVAVSDTITVFMIGDSTMADKPLDKENQERGWGQALPDLLQGAIKVDNHAKNGRSSLSFINEGRWGVVLSKIKPGDYLFIQFGHNDEKLDVEGKTPRHTIPGSTFDEILTKYVTEARAKGAIPVLFNSIVRRNFPPEEQDKFDSADTNADRKSYKEEGNVLVSTHGFYTVAPKNVARKLNVPFVDMTALTFDLVSSLGVEKSKELYMWVPAGKYEFCPEGKVDNTHLNIYGAHVIAAIAIKAVAEIVPELRPYLREGI
jgi:lysophospholipase L1-like esterase